jgi:hypothetical protein
VKADLVIRTDGNDSLGGLDIRAVTSREHYPVVIHKVTTFESWRPSVLDDSTIVIAFDRNDDRRFERCAYVFFRSRLRGALTNCRRDFIASLSVSRPSASSISVAVPVSQTHMQYRWAVFSYFRGSGSCSDVCADVVPNRYPLLLHDFQGPVVRYETNDDLLAWRVSNSTNHPFRFKVSDGLAGSGLAAWEVQRRPVNVAGWETLATGTRDGWREPVVPGTSGSWHYRVVATDRNGNVTRWLERNVLIPFDVAIGGPGTFVGDVELSADVDAFMGSLVGLDAGDSYQHMLEPPLGVCGSMLLVGPGDGDWVVEVRDDDVVVATVSADQYADGQRRTLFFGGACAASTFTFTVVSGSGFAVDAVFAS